MDDAAYHAHLKSIGAKDGKGITTSVRQAGKREWLPAEIAVDDLSEDEMTQGIVLEGGHDVRQQQHTHV